jgi:hypothetical protein
LHTLFASGTAHVNELERYIKDDILRNGSRLADLEKKLINAYEDIVRASCIPAIMRLTRCFRRLMKPGMTTHFSALKKKRTKKANLSCMFDFCDQRIYQLNSSLGATLQNHLAKISLVYANWVSQRNLVCLH